MIATTDAQTVVIRHRLTKNLPHNDLFIEVDDLERNPVAAFSSASSAAAWLATNGFEYVEGSPGVWSKSKKKTGGGISLTASPSTPTPSQRAKTRKMWRNQLLWEGLMTAFTVTVGLGMLLYLVL